jgi:hypothetical protein
MPGLNPFYWLTCGFIVAASLWWLNFGHSSHGFYSGSGTWSVVKDFQGHWVVEVRFTSLPGYENGLLISLRIGQSKASYYIYDFIGDPDSGHVMVFERL